MSGSVRIIPLGGLGEIGKNMTVYETEGGSIVLDAGLAFPRDEQLGVDLVLPDFSYIRDLRQPPHAVVLTHAHEDHVGALPYLLREVPIGRVLATRLTLGLVQSKLDEHGLLHRAELVEVRPEDEPVDVGPFRLEFVRMAHSVPDNVAVLVEAGGPHPAHERLQARPHAGGRLQDGRRAARRARQPGGRPDAWRLDERRAPGLHRLRAPRRRGISPDHPSPQGPGPRRELRLERPSHAAGDRRRPRGRPEGVRDRPLDAEEPEHRQASATSRCRTRRSSGRPSSISTRRTSCSCSAPAARASRCPP